mgnify:CR=1 FL=1
MLLILKVKRMVILLLIILITFLVVFLGYTYYKLNSMYIPDDKLINKQDLSKKDNKSIINVLLIGVDNYKLDKGSRSDCMMIMTIDNKNKNIKLTSLARDTYVYIKGYDREKLTHAYAYGGSELLLQTIKDNFQIDIDNYVTFNFASFEKIIDILGGVEVNVLENDIDMLNKYIEVGYGLRNDQYKKDTELDIVEHSGIQTLNGYQALAFSRIRYQDSAYKRDARQREVVKACIKKLNDITKNKYINILDTMSEDIKTNIKVSQMLNLGENILDIGISNLISLEFPINKKEELLDKKGWVITWEKGDIDILKDFIFENKIQSDS